MIGFRWSPPFKMSSEFWGQHCWIIMYQTASGVSTIKFGLGGLWSNHRFPDDKIKKRFNNSKRLYLINKLRKRVVEDCTYEKIYSRANGGWQINWIMAKCWRWSLRRYIRFLRRYNNIILNENNILLIKWHFEYIWNESIFIGGPLIRHVIWSENHFLPQIDREIYFNLRTNNQ